LPAQPGGLCLAQGLARAGVRVRVLERDATPRTRGQGYRLRSTRTALPRCAVPARRPAPVVPGHHEPAVLASGVVFDHRLEQVASFGDAVEVTERLRLSAIANRSAPPDLLAGLENTVEFGREVVGVREDGERVEAWLADGSVVTVMC